jgi:hypothetical protein
MILQGVRNMDCEPRFSNSAWISQRYEADIIPRDQSLKLVNFPVATNQAGGKSGKRPKAQQTCHDLARACGCG